MLSIEVKKVEVKYPNFLLSIPPITFSNGQKIAILGPSGSGKTTFLRLLAGLQSPGATSEIFISNKKLDTLPRKDRSRNAYVSQELGLISNLSAHESVLQGGLGKYRVPRIGVRTYPKQDVATAKNLLSEFGISPAEKLVSEFSGGQQQRIAIARAMMQNPGILIIDEPVSSLDPATSEDVLQLLNKSKELLVVAALHQPELVKRYFDRVIGIKEGKLKFDLPCNELNDSVISDLYTTSVFDN